MTEELITHKTAVLTKEKGFSEDCLYSYSTNDEGEIILHLAVDSTGELYFTKDDIRSAEENDYPSWLAPTQSLLQQWLREVHDINIIIVPSFHCYNISHIMIFDTGTDINNHINLDGLEFKDFKTYELALEAALKKALLLIKTDRDD